MVPAERKLLELLSNNDVTFFIPPYQRNYEWDDKQCKVFWEDVLKTSEINSNGKHAEHFFGSVTYFADEVVFGQPTKLILIDGQQRITTTMLFLVALRDILDDEKQRQFIDNKYLKNANTTDNTEYKIKLKQVESDWVAYKNIILGEELTEEEKDSSVYRNYSYFKNKLLTLQNNKIVLTDLMSHGLNNFSVITIELQPKQNSWENPQEIFESMNSIGKPLSLADLVRNYLLLGLDAKTQDKFYKKYWLKLEKRIPKQISVFIRDYMQGMMARAFKQATDTNYKELYSLFKTNFAEVPAETLLNDFVNYSILYAYITQNKATGSTIVDKALKDIRLLTATTAYSFILMIMAEWQENKLTDDELVDILNAIKIYIFRRRIIGLTYAENKTFPTLVNKVPDIVESSNKSQKTFEVLSGLDNAARLPNDIEIKRELEAMNFYASKYAKTSYALIEEHMTKSRPDLSDNNLQIEHIMPQKLNDEWKEALGSDYERIHQNYVNNIGNLTLIRHNQELGNSSFTKKKEIYENNSGLQIAKTKITDCKEWDERAIQSRADWLIDYLLNNIIPIPDSMRRTNNFVSKSSNGLSFLELQLIGNDISFIADPSITAHVVGDKEVEFEGKRWRLSPLTKELYTRKGTVNKSGSYQGAQHWAYDGIKLADIM